MTHALPARPDLDHLRGEAKQMLAEIRAGDPAALARVAAHGPGLAPALSTTQLVVAREYGFASWAQLKRLVTSMSAGGVRYDSIGHGYAAHRRADPRIAVAVHRALSDARTVVNVGAGAGSYEPTDRPVIPVEPSTAMALQRHPTLPPAVLGVAESLPFADSTADAAMAVMTMHHWADVDRGIAELVRVARHRIVLLTIDQDIAATTWLFKEYTPEIAERDRREFPVIDRLLAALQAPTRVLTVPVPADCTDGFALALWNRPEMILDPGIRAATSGFARMDSGRETEAVERLECDLLAGTWQQRHGHLRELTEFDIGLRLLVTELP